MINADAQRAYPRVLPVGEEAFTVEFGAAVDVRLNQQVHALDRALAAGNQAGIIECVPTYRSLLVIYDRRTIAPTELQDKLLALAQATRADSRVSEGHLVEIPVHYGGEAGTDLEEVAAHCRLTPSEVVELHTSVTYQVAMLGFAPGFAYLLGLPDALATPRLVTPRLRVAPGSVGIAGNQTGIYALSTPGGWRIIGRTDLTLFDPTRRDPFTLQAGDPVRFVVV